MVTAVFVTAKILEEVLGAQPSVELDIYDLGLTVDPPSPDLRPGALVYDGPREVRNGSEDGLLQTLDLNVGSRRWRIGAAPGPRFVVTLDQRLPWGVVASGVALTLLVSGLVVSFGRSRRLAVALAEKMTADLAERESELREANRR